MSDTLSVGQAMALLPQREPDEQGRIPIHTVVESGFALMGADWPREEIIALLERAEAIYLATGIAKAQGNALCVHERQADGTLRRVFVEGMT